MSLPFDMDEIVTIIWFPNGTAAVCNRRGQVPKYQVGWHGDTIAALESDGIDWRNIRDQMGRPMDGEPWWSRERKMRETKNAPHPGG